MSDVVKQAIETVLADKDIKKAILDYLKSVTVEPKQEWREIYHCQSEIRTRNIGVDPNTLVDNATRDYRLYMRVYYNDSGNVARVIFFEYDARLFERQHDNYWAWGYSVGGYDEDTVLISESEPSLAIDHALALWPERKAAFEAQGVTT